MMLWRYKGYGYAELRPYEGRDYVVWYPDENLGSEEYSVPVGADPLASFEAAFNLQAAERAELRLS
jgi:hypothetical protein